MSLPHTTPAVTTVGEAMLCHPAVHPAGLTVAQAREAFRASPKTHMLLLARQDILLGTLTRDDLDCVCEGPAMPLASLAGRTVTPEVPLVTTREAMRRGGIRRLAVIDGRGRLLGLLCLKRSLRGFCTDEGVAAMRGARLTPVR